MPHRRKAPLPPPPRGLAQAGAANARQCGRLREGQAAVVRSSREEGPFLQAIQSLGAHLRPGRRARRGGRGRRAAALGARGLRRTVPVCAVGDSRKRFRIGFREDVCGAHLPGGDDCVFLRRQRHREEDRRGDLGARIALRHTHALGEFLGRDHRPGLDPPRRLVCFWEQLRPSRRGSVVRPFYGALRYRRPCSDQGDPRSRLPKPTSDHSSHRADDDDVRDVVRRDDHRGQPPVSDQGHDQPHAVADALPQGDRLRGDADGSGGSDKVEARPRKVRLGQPGRLARRLPLLLRDES
mmetsp:Transcript_7818/g.27782  ORF Transcript_7818/g.27782 Transcript_7818/m.27782 type:complete len:296 (+) Transcript_7818:1268-2155(+)